MSVLILHHRGTLAAHAYDRWLADYEGDVLLLASKEHLGWVGEELPTGETGYSHMEALDDYEVGGVLEARVLDLARRYGVSRLFTCQEHDLERAAQLREILGLPGQTFSSALPFRNKLLMKETVQAAGIEVAAHRGVECAGDLVSFAREHGFPVVVKPRDGAGSIGVTVLRSREELDAFVAERLDVYGPLQSNLMVEAFVPGAMCHVDGLVVDGKVALAWPSQYLFTLASFKELRGGRHDVTLDRDDPLARRLLDFTDRVLDALPCPPNFTFHAEVFHTPDDRLVLCEIACRTGGAQTRGVIKTIFGAELNECWVRAEAGLPLPIDIGPERPEPVKMTGQLLLSRRPGKVVELPGEPPFPWVEEYKISVERGEVMRVSRYSADVMCCFLVSGPDRATCQSRLQELEDWFLDGLVLEELPEDEVPAAPGGEASAVSQDEVSAVPEGEASAVPEASRSRS
ncbi:ATP-grasp domain-containing protein [Streptosporangium sandarakinum]|uniref:ATP-grasp domain-containing protein n=1 Tax=Streptosporangium nondiastaticum TaxID=35764 RepID=UPI0031F942EE